MLEPLLRTTVIVTLPALCAAAYVGADNSSVSGSVAAGGEAGGAGDAGGGAVAETGEPEPPQAASAQAADTIKAPQASFLMVLMSRVL
jgi:hypothetical protein